MSQPNRLAADADHQFGGIELDRSKPLSFRLDGRKIEGFAGDTVLSAALANGIDTYGTFDDMPIALSDRFAPLVSTKRGEPMPMDRTPALDGLDLGTIGRRKGMSFGQPQSLRLDLMALEPPPWRRAMPTATLSADLLVVGGGIAGLTAAAAAAHAGHSVILAERRPWLGGDGRYFGAVGDEESPEAVTTQLIADLRAQPSVTVLTRAEVFALDGQKAIAHQVEVAGNLPVARVVALDAPRIILATGATQRLPVFPGNRSPGVTSAIAAYHLAKRYGVTRGRSAIVATQSNHGYRLALRLQDAGVTVRRVFDTRIHPQSRFVDFAKAGGLTLASGQFTLAARPTRGALHLSFANAGTNSTTAEFDAQQLIVSGGWQPELTLWMLAGGPVRWSGERSALMAVGSLDHVALAGSAVGYRSMRACAASGRVAQAVLFGEASAEITDAELGTHLETPDAPTMHAPSSTNALSFLMGRGLASRPSRADAASLSLEEVAASVELGIIAGGDAGALAEERGVPGVELVASDWKPRPSQRPATYLEHRFGDDPQRVHLVVDHRRRFEIGALIYPNTVKADPALAIGVIVDAAKPGGIALIAKSALRRTDRFIVETEAGPSPARLAATQPAADPVS